jgi:iron complex outermembrane receptor protein
VKSYSVPISLSAAGGSGLLDWQVIGTLYDFTHDVQRIPTGTLPAASAGGAGTITRLDGTGWKTMDARAALRLGAAATHAISVGAHADWFTLSSNRYATTDWITGSEGALNLQSKGRTSTAALTLTVGGRYEWWRAYDGVNFSSSPAISAAQPALSANRFSPKASLAWDPAKNWTMRLSFGEAWRFPTVGELYQIVTSPVSGVPNPNLRPERALSEELAIERHDKHGSVRLSLFNEAVKDALISQLGPLNGTATIATFVQNVDRTRARGVELAFQQTDLVPRVDLSGSATYADATTRSDAAVPAAVGKLLPSVPHWKATLVATWRPTDRISLTAAGRYSSRQYGSIDNSDVVGNTYQGFYKYLVIDLRAQFRVTRHWSLGLGVDNVNNDRYFLFHPFPQRSVTADLTVKF